MTIELGYVFPAFTVAALLVGLCFTFLSRQGSLVRLCSYGLILTSIPGIVLSLVEYLQVGKLNYAVLVHLSEYALVIGSLQVLLIVLLVLAQIWAGLTRSKDAERSAPQPPVGPEEPREFNSLPRFPGGN